MARHARQRRAMEEHVARRLAELKARRAMVAEDLEKMRHFPEQVQIKKQAYIDTLDQTIATMEGRNGESIATGQES